MQGDFVTARRKPGSSEAATRSEPDKEQHLLAIVGQKISKSLAGSPYRIRDRTFSARFELPWANKEPKPLPSYYPNPLVIAQNWQQRLETGQAATRAELARQLGVSRAHVTQVLRLLSLTPEVKEAILYLGNPIEGRVIGQHTLRSLVRLPAEEQRTKTLEFMARNRRPNSLHKAHQR